MSNKVLDNKDKADLKLLRFEIQSLTEEVAQMNSNSTFLKLALKGFINGIFSALGATIGFTLVIIFLAQAFKGADKVPLLDTVLQRTQIDKIIDYQLEQIQSNEDDEQNQDENDQDEETSGEQDQASPTPSVTPEVTINNE